MSQTRQLALSVLIAGAVTVGLTGCADGSSSPKRPPAPRRSSPTEASAGFTHATPIKLKLLQMTGRLYL
jgi:hypothetical protein